MCPRHCYQPDFEGQNANLPYAPAIVDVQQPVESQVHAEFIADHCRIGGDVDVLVNGRENLDHFWYTDKQVIRGLLEVMLIQGRHDIGKSYEINCERN